MNTERFEDILDESLRMMEAGVTLEDCVTRHPRYAEELHAQLAMAQTLRASRVSAQPELAAVARSRALLLSTAAQQRDARNGHASGTPFPLFGAAARRLLVVPYALPSALALVLLGGAAFGVSAATGNADPRGWFVASSSQSQIELHGVLSAIDATSLTVETSEGPVQAAITPDTEFDDEQGEPTTLAAFAVGDTVRVHAVRADDGSLVAREVEIEGLEDAVDDLADGTPADGGDGANDGVNDGAVDDLADGTPDAVDDGAGDDLAGGTPDNVDDGAVDDLADATPDAVDDGAVDDLADATPNDVDDGAVDDLADATPDNVDNGAVDDPGGAPVDDLDDGAIADGDGGDPG